MPPVPGSVVCDGDSCTFVPSDKGAAAAAAPQQAASLSATETLLGSGPLLGQGGASVPSGSLAGPGKVLGLYFSAHWCPPCRGFTPVLAEWYTKFKASAGANKDDFEIVFVSSDRDEASFAEYFASMPWLALPFAARDTKAALSTQFKVKGIPAFILLDAHTGAVLNASARNLVGTDPEAKGFPWRPPTFSDMVAGAKLTDANGGSYDAAEKLAGKPVMLYFSAHWCPPCRGFTPQLAETYASMKEANTDFECVFVSSDRDEAQFQEYLGSMPWLALEYPDRARKAQLSELYGVSGIPTLVVIDSDGTTITTNGRGAVDADPEGTDFPWRPKALEKLSQMCAELINEGAALVLFVDGEGSSDSAAVKAAGARVLGALAVSSKAAQREHGEKACSFVYGALGDGMVQTLLRFVGVDGSPGGGDGLVLLDLPSKVYYVRPSGARGPVTPDDAADMLAQWHAGSLAKLTPAALRQ